MRKVTDFQVQVRRFALHRNAKQVVNMRHLFLSLYSDLGCATLDEFYTRGASWQTVTRTLDGGNQGKTRVRERLKAA
jgi:hypothetical protein